MNKLTINLIRTVAEDLDYIMNQWDQEIDDASLRRNSVVLRRLLVEGDYSRAWRMLGFTGEPRLYAENFHNRFFENNVKLEQIVLAVAGGTSYHGMKIEGIRMIDFALSKKEIKKNSQI